MDETLNALLPLFKNYYNIKTEDVEEPFVAEAAFESHNEQYYLIKAATVADVDMNEYVYFAKCDTLTPEELAEYQKLEDARAMASAEGFPTDEGSKEALVPVYVGIEMPASEHSSEISTILNEEHSLIMAREITPEEGIEEMNERVAELFE